MDVEFFELDGQVLFGGGRGDLAAVHGCLQMDLHMERPVRSASGVLHLMPLGTAALCGKQRRAGGKGGGSVEGCFGAWSNGSNGPCAGFCVVHFKLRVIKRVTKPYVSTLGAGVSS